MSVSLKIWKSSSPRGIWGLPFCVWVFALTYGDPCIQNLGKMDLINCREILSIFDKFLKSVKMKLPKMFRNFLETKPF